MVKNDIIELKNNAAAIDSKLVDSDNKSEALEIRNKKSHKKMHLKSKKTGLPLKEQELKKKSNDTDLDCTRQGKKKKNLKR